MREKSEKKKKMETFLIKLKKEKGKFPNHLELRTDPSSAKALVNLVEGVGREVNRGPVEDEEVTVD